MGVLMNSVIVTFKGDRPGTLAKATETISKAGINIEGCAEVEGIYHVLTQEATAARRALEAARFKVREQQVYVTPVKDRPGVAADLFRRIANAKINVRFTYVATNNRLVIGTTDPKRVLKLLG